MMPLSPCFVAYWIEKWSSRGHLLEHLESSGTNYDEKICYMPVIIIPKENCLVLIIRDFNLTH